MDFFKVINEFSIFTAGQIILVNGSSHYGRIVILATPKNKTIYTNIRIDYNLVKQNCIHLTRNDVLKIRHHLTWRIWINDASRICNNVGAQGFSFDVLNEKDIDGGKPKLLPYLMCYDCLKEGNKYIPHNIKSVQKSLCRCCMQDKKLHYTQYGYPLNLKSKGFGFTIIGSGENYFNNISYYNRHFDMSIYKDFKG